MNLKSSSRGRKRVFRKSVTRHPSISLGISLPNLQFISIAANRFTGKVPSFDQLHKLSRLSIVYNHLGSGNVDDLGFLSPLTNATSLIVLDTGNNNFGGELRKHIGNLSKKLEIFNIESNQIFGCIPSGIDGLVNMPAIYATKNKLSGSIPTEGVFKNASETLVAGNENLCGGRPDFRLPGCKFEQPKRRLSVKLKIIISAIAVLIGATFMLVGLHLCKSRKKKEKSASCSYGNELLKLSYQNPLKATNGFSSDNLIETGSFGSVYKGMLEQQQLTIAVKVLNLMRGGASKSFIAQCRALRNIKHRNLVRLLTACSGVDYRGNDFKVLVYEFMVNGSLDDWLHPALGSDEVRRTLNILQRLKIAIDIACALEYLHHHCETPIVHCDLKPSNVLLDEEMTGCVSDFRSSSIGIRGTIGYCPPEYGWEAKFLYLAIYIALAYFCWRFSRERGLLMICLDRHCQTCHTDYRSQPSSDAARCKHNLEEQ
ncbi:serine-threonine protein kinase, plant-type, putative [Ricinus communis]|uniref:Serine-threonine protein kinase, plant-type, putative n=1 Tax=Ricinus communis TaxID=3988 RepID=B9SS79_RICCO|nr:serine-threonine protein kinase, plant-type, putative [Ricinus communis]